MALTGKQKAALLLTTLDAATASELLRGLNAQVVQDLAVELSYLDAAGHRNTQQTTEVARLFCKSLNEEAGFHFKSFLRQMLRNTVGEDQAGRIQNEVEELLRKRDPFLPIRSADPSTLAAVLEAEHPQAVAIVLSELHPKKSSDILGLLGEGVRVGALSRMTGIGSVTQEARTRIAQMVGKRLETMAAAHQSGTAMQVHPEQSLRKVAVIVRNLEKEVRDGVLEVIRQKDEEAGRKVANLMVIWDDIPLVGDRALQQALRTADERQLAMALHEAPDETAKKIRSNLSERTITLLDEEITLMSSPKSEDVRSAREKIVSTLRELNDKGELSFEKE